MGDSAMNGRDELAAPPGPKVLRDPIHDLIYLGPEDRWILDLIDTKEFQRLRRIRQLGVAHLVYPGAEHTRFTHSLGVFNFARRIIHKLLDRHGGDPDIRETLKQNTRAIKAAALLHDLGHGPFSHVFERVFKEESPESRSHEEWTCHILRNEETEVHQCLQKVKGVEIEDVYSLISDGEGHPEPYLKGIVSSQLDADRMDYLLRDSLMTGSRYGQYDSEWILNALVIGQPRLESRSDRMLCLDASKGTGAIEELLFARLLMFKYVYGHKTTRAYEAELIQTLRLALRLGNELPCETPAPIQMLLQEGRGLSVKNYLMLDDEVMWWALRRWAAWDGASAENKEAATALKRHARRLVRRERPWRSVEIHDQERIWDLRQQAEELEDKDPRLEFEYYIDDLKNHLPYREYQYRHEEKGEDEQSFFQEIFLLAQDGRADRLAKVAKSPVLKGLTEESRVWRLHYDREFSKEFAGLH